MSENLDLKKKSDGGSAPPAQGTTLTLAAKNLQLLERMKPEFNKVLSKIKPEYFLRVALSAVNKNPKILQCTTESILSCMMDLATLNLVPDSQRGFAWLIPYGNICQLQIGYLGYAEILYRGEVALIVCNVIYKKDIYEEEQGTNARLRYVPYLGNRGVMRGAYSYVKFKDGTESFISMNMEDLLAVRKKSKKDAAGKESPAWREFEPEMYKKCVFRRHFKLLPRVDESIRRVIEDDIDKDFELDPEKEITNEPMKRAKFDSNINVPKHDQQPSQTVDAEYTDEPADRPNTDIEPESASQVTEQESAMAVQDAPAAEITAPATNGEEENGKRKAKSEKRKQTPPVPKDEASKLPFFEGDTSSAHS